MLETSRLVLREVNADDMELLVALRVDLEVRRFVGGPLSLDAAKSMAELNIAYPRGKFAVERRDNRDAIGLVVLHPGHGGTEISYQFLPSSWRQGFAGEAVRCVIDDAMDSEEFGEEQTRYRTGPPARELATGTPRRASGATVES